MSSRTTQNYNIGDRVFVKMKGYPFWPALVKDRIPGKVETYKVYFYGTYESANVIPGCMYPYNDETKAKFGKPQRKGGAMFLKAMEEIQQNFEIREPEPQTELFQEIDKDVEVGVTEDSQADFEVKSILDRRVRDGKIQYFIEWEGYPPTANTWEPLGNLNCLDLIQKFETKGRQTRSSTTVATTREESATTISPSKQRGKDSSPVVKRRGKNTLTQDSTQVGKSRDGSPAIKRKKLLLDTEINHPKAVTSMTMHPDNEHPMSTMVTASTSSSLPISNVLESVLASEAMKPDDFDMDERQGRSRFRSPPTSHRDREGRSRSNARHDNSQEFSSSNFPIFLPQDPQVGKIYLGKVTALVAYGCFIQLIELQKTWIGLCHISKLQTTGMVNHVSDVVKIGQEVKVKVISFTGTKLGLSMKFVDQGTGIHEVFNHRRRREDAQQPNRPLEGDLDMRSSGEHREPKICNICNWAKFPAENAKYRAHVKYCSRMSTMLKNANSNRASQMAGSEVPVLHPTAEELCDITAYITKIQGKFIDHVPMIKLVPPPGFQGLALNDLANKDFRTFRFDSRKKEYVLLPKAIKGDKFNGDCYKSKIQQVFKQLPSSDKTQKEERQEAVEGIFLASYSNNQRVSVADYCQQSDEHQDLSEEEAEDLFWDDPTKVTTRYMNGMFGVPSPMIGLPMESQTKLGSLLTGLSSKGITHPYLYAGHWGSFAPFHLEDKNLYSLNQCIGNESSKLWYGIATRHKVKFEKIMVGLFRKQHETCHAFLRHKDKLVSPVFLKKNGIDFYRTVQTVGEIIVTFPFGYHQVLNLKSSLNIAVNFASKTWIDYGLLATRCHTNCYNYWQNPEIVPNSIVTEHLGVNIYDIMVQDGTIR